MKNNYLQYYDNLTKSEKKIISNFDRLEKIDISSSINDISDILNASSTSLFRLIKKIGYSNFLEFKMDIVNDKETLPKNETIKSINRTYELLAKSNIENVVKLIKESNKIIIAGYGMNHYIASILETKLRIMGYDATHIFNSWYERLSLKNTNKDDLVICITKTGKSSETLNVINEARDLNLNIILLIEESDIKQKMLTTECIEVSTTLKDEVTVDTRLQMHIAIDYILSKLN